MTSDHSRGGREATRLRRHRPAGHGRVPTWRAARRTLPFGAVLTVVLALLTGWDPGGASHRAEGLQPAVPQPAGVAGDAVGRHAGRLLLPSAVAGRHSGFERGDFSDFDGANTLRGELQIEEGSAFRGERSARASFPGGGGIGFARVIWDVNWAPGSVVCYGAAFLLPRFFTESVGGSVDLMRWDNYAIDPHNTDHGGLTVWQDGGLRLISEQLGRNNYEVLLGPYDLPQGRWVRLAVEQRLEGKGPAYSILFVNGEQKGISAAPNAFGRPVTSIRWGVVAVDQVKQRSPVHLRFDEAFFREGSCLQ